MNNKIKELAEQAGFEDGHLDPYYGEYSCEPWLQKFAELIIKEAMQNIYERVRLSDHQDDAETLAVLWGMNYSISIIKETFGSE